MDIDQINCQRCCHHNEIFNQSIPLIYVLHSGQLYGSERMTINIARSLTIDRYFPAIMAPQQLALAEAAKYGIITNFTPHYISLIRCFNNYLAKYPKLIFVTTSFSQSILIMLCNLFYRRQISHFHIVHGGAEEYLSYARKSFFNYLPVRLIAVSSFVYKRLIFHGVISDKIKVIENFLLSSETNSITSRSLFDTRGIKQILIISRIDPIKRIDLLFKALDFAPPLNNLCFHIFGFGKDFNRLKKQAQAKYPNITFYGFTDKIFEKMANSDLLLHLCPTEPFGMAVLEAMAVGLPVLVPNQGATKTLIENEVSGFHFQANDFQDLALNLLKLTKISPEKLNLIVKNAKVIQQSKYSENRGILAYRQLFNF